MTTRRDSLIVLGIAALAPVMALGQSKAPIVIGWLHTNSRSQGNTLSGFKEGMAALGWKEGASFVLEERWADGHYDRLPALAREIAASKPAVIVAAPSNAVAAAAKAAPAIPVVIAGGDPLANQLVPNLAHPGGMITGVSNVSTQIADKYCELMLEAVPGVRRIGVLHATEPEPFARTLAAWRTSLAQRSVELIVAQVPSPDAVEQAVTRLAKSGAQALVVYPSPLLTNQRQRIVELAMARRWPIIGLSTFADTSALLSYGADRVALTRRAAYYVDKILKGAKPGDLPIEQPTKFELVVNMKTAKTLGLKIPQTILVQATRVIE